MCWEKHHHTLCPLRNTQTRVTSALAPSKREHIAAPSRPTAVKRDPSKVGDKQRYKKPTQVHAHTEETNTSKNSEPMNNDNPSFGTVLSTIKDNNAHHEGNNEIQPKANTVLLLSGAAKVKDSAHDQWREVGILLDTGADQSFISHDLAEELGFVCEAQKGFMVYTFGATKPKHTTCKLTTLELLDDCGVRHEMRLHTAPVITAVTKSAQLSTADLAFMVKRNIRLSNSVYQNGLKHHILLGCDQLWNLLDVPHPHYRLPSGLHLLPSK